MATVGAFEAKTHLAKLLERVAKGEEFIITRRGKPVARLVPIEENQSERAVAAVCRIRELRKGLPRTTLEELLSWRHEGHRF